MAISSHPSRSMAIDSLLNPPSAADSDKPASKIRYSPGPLTPQYSPIYPPSPNQYYYSFDNQQHHHHHHNPYSSHGRTPSSSQDSQHHHHLHHHSFNSYPYPSHSYSRSAASSPEPYSRDRYDSVSSSSSTNGGPSHGSHSRGHHSHVHSSAGDRRRPPRPKYEEEEMYFIWYHRVDLCQEWKEVRESFNRQFPARQRSGFQGIQCKFYRFIKEKKCPTLREQRRMRDGEFLRQDTVPTPASTGGFHGGAPQFGVVEWMGVWYPWMREDREEVMRKRLAR
ncbi:uncharacterized protein BDV17DRAFT_266812 [Aspergillus undulatus]|uniref:uncharacterized protein n=1 Tax=Aspergillus undulatus TaxID=1810928 RepID=UPI003CCCED67